MREAKQGSSKRAAALPVRFLLLFGGAAAPSAPLPRSCSVPFLPPERLDPGGDCCALVRFIALIARAFAAATASDLALMSGLVWFTVSLRVGLLLAILFLVSKQDT